ncbi:hypothetical protein GCM10028789_18130 [Sinomonas halotolerans]
MQTAAPDEGSKQDAQRFDVKTADGEHVATLHTGVPVAFSKPCAAKDRKPYTVLVSEPVDVPFADIPGAIEPRFVFRVVQGRQFVGSYGITTMPTAVDGKVCELQNEVSGPEATGGFWFGDQPKVIPGSEQYGSTRTMFDTLAQASTYVEESTEFADVQRMIMSLEFTARP